MVPLTEIETAGVRGETLLQRRVSNCGLIYRFKVNVNIAYFFNMQFEVNVNTAFETFPRN